MYNSGRVIIVCGGRDFGRCADERRFIFRMLDELHKKQRIGVVIHGGARGADSCAGEWADRNQLWNWKCNASWKTLGKAAGMERNRRMMAIHKILRIALCVAFPGGVGTAGMAKIARDNGTHVIRPDFAQGKLFTDCDDE